MGWTSWTNETTSNRFGQIELERGLIGSDRNGLKSQTITPEKVGLREVGAVERGKG